METENATCSQWLGLWLCFVVLCGGCDGNTIASDRAFADRLIASELQPRMTFPEVRSFLARHDSDAVLQDGCGLRPPHPPSCAYSTVTVLPLPGHNWWRGQGGLQIFMVFDAQERLLSLDYELIYPGSSEPRR